MGSGAVERIEVEGRRLAWRTVAWRTVGGGTPLVLVNGYAATGEDWDPAFVAGLGEPFEGDLPR